MKRWVRPLVLALAFSATWTAVAASGVLDQADLAVQDALYQERSAPEEDIAVIGIDDRAIEELGPYSEWGRDIIAQAIEALNKSEDTRPAAIAVDVLFAGETDPEIDEWLAEAAGRYGNVVTAELAQIEDTFVEDESGAFHRDQFAVTDFEEPYDALKDVTTQGHINAMLDTDGVLRHHLLSLTLPDGTAVPSMALAAAELYQQYHGEEAASLPPVDENGFWYVPFTGDPGDFDSGVSVADLLAGDVPAEEFAGKIVFIGPYTTGLQDHFVTAADHAEPMYGVEYQANAAHAILWGSPKEEVSRTLQLILLFIVLVVAFYAFWDRSVLFSTIVWLLLSGGWILLCMLLYRQGYVLRILWVPLGVTILYVACIAYNYVRSALEKTKVTNTFKRYVAPEIVQEILKEGPRTLELGGKMTSIAVLFVDVRGFTSMSEQLDAPEVVDILNRFLTLIAGCILGSGGTLDKFIGDAAMAFWGAPVREDDYVMLAAKAAMNMVEGSRALTEELTERFGRSVAFGIGIHVGEAVVGNIGSPDRMDYTAIGDTVNTAQRLESSAPPGTIYISRAVADSLEGRIRTAVPDGPVKLKGKADGFEVLILKEILPDPPQ